MKKYLLSVVCYLLAVPLLSAAINNVQSYSSSPFYQTGVGTYNQGFPVPVYVKGPNLTAAECQIAVNSAIWTQCSFRNNCANTTLGDIRPGIITELSMRTDANYASACAGYIDSLFVQYKQQAASQVQTIGFPSVPAGQPSTQTIRPNAFTYDNMTPDWKKAEDLRGDMLTAMQRQNAPAPTLTATAMPKTFEDLGFQERMEVLQEGYQHPAVGQYDTYAGLNIESDASAKERILANAQHELAMAAAGKDVLKESDYLGWCTKYPKDCEGEGYKVVEGKLERINQVPPSAVTPTATPTAGTSAPAANAGVSPEMAAMIESLSNTISNNLKP